MFLEVIKLVCMHIEQWGLELFGEEEDVHNPFAFNNYLLWDKAKQYLYDYIEQEIDKMFEDDQVLIFVNRKDEPFKRVNGGNEQALEQIISQLEADFNQPMTDIDRAYLSCRFYNDVEQMIVEQAIVRKFVRNVKSYRIALYFFAKKTGIMVQQGKEVLFSELEELYTIRNYKLRLQGYGQH